MDWDDSLTTGDEAIDAQHRALLELCDGLSCAENDGPSAVRRVLDDITEYVAVHFSMEQELMERTEFPRASYDQHVAEHDRMTQLTREKVLEYRAGKLNSVKPILTWLNEWIAGHVVEMDTAFADHVRRRAAGDD